MPHLPIHLIVTDLDGTLLNSAHEVAPFTAQALDAAIARGVHFTVATGKTFPSTTAIIARFGITLPVICGNGTQIFAPDGTLLHEDPIPLAHALEAIALAQAWDFTAVVYARMGLLAPVRDANVAELVAHHEPEPLIVRDLATALRNGHKPYKLVLMHRDLEHVARFQDHLTHVFSGRAQIIRSGLASVVEVLPAGVTKGTALAWILDYAGLRAEQTIAFGDNCNDVDLLRRAGIGVAMGNAPAEVRAQADRVTGTNDDDGVGQVIQALILAPAAAPAAPTGQQTGRR